MVTSVFLSCFWVSKWHPKILQWHPKFWNLDMILPCIEVKQFEESIFPARGYCNRRLQCYSPTQFSGTEVGSENCEYGTCGLSCGPPRFGLLLYCRRIVRHGVRNCESTSMQLWKFFTVSPLRSACLAMHQTTMKTKGPQLQRACKARWLSSEATVRGVKFWPHWSSCQKIKMKQCALFYCDLWKQKYLRGTFVLSTLPPHLTELS